jgi:hypothetical protein
LKTIVSHLADLAKHRTSFLDFVHITISAFAGVADNPAFSTVGPVSLQVLEIAKLYSGMRNIKDDALGFNPGGNELVKFLKEDLMKVLVTFIGRLAGTWIKVDDAPADIEAKDSKKEKSEEKKKKDGEKSDEKKKESDKEKMIQGILSSKLLSGGIENRFIKIFSKKFLHQLKELVEITDDNKIKNYLEDEEDNDEDILLKNIITPGKSLEEESFIDVFQLLLKKKGCMWHNANGEKGMLLCRYSFACMIKIATNFEEIMNLIDQNDMNITELPMNLDEADKIIELAALAKELPAFDKIFDRWEASSRMRTWLSDKKKNLSNRKGYDEKVSGEKTKEDVEVEKIFERIKDKASLLIKLSMPSAWSQDSQIILSDKLPGIADMKLYRALLLYLKKK